jgi:hypothetical protein
VELWLLLYLSFSFHLAGMASFGSPFDVAGEARCSLQLSGSVVVYAPFLLSPSRPSSRRSPRLGVHRADP